MARNWNIETKPGDVILAKWASSEQVILCKIKEFSSSGQRLLVRHWAGHVDRWGAMTSVKRHDVLAIIPPARQSSEELRAINAACRETSEIITQMKQLELAIEKARKRVHARLVETVVGE